MFEKLRRKSKVNSIIGAVILTLCEVLLIFVMSAADGAEIIFMIFIAVLAALIIFILYQGFSGKNLEDIEEYCKTQGNREWALKRIEEFYNAAPPVNGLRINNEFFMHLAGNNVSFAETREVLWVYLNITKHSYNFIPTGKTYAIMVMLADGTSITMNQKNKKAAEATMEYIGNSLPYIIFGYDEQIAQIYGSNRQEMMRVVNERKMQCMANQGASVQQVQY